MGRPSPRHRRLHDSRHDLLSELACRQQNGVQRDPELRGSDTSHGYLFCGVFILAHQCLARIPLIAVLYCEFERVRALKKRCVWCEICKCERDCPGGMKYSLSLTAPLRMCGARVRVPPYLVSRPGSPVSRRPGGDPRPGARARPTPRVHRGRRAPAFGVRCRMATHCSGGARDLKRI